MRTQDEQINALCRELEKNIADEAEARMGYYQLLDLYDYMFTSKELDDIREIISEELKHTILLEQMIKRRNGIIAED